MSHESPPSAPRPHPERAVRAGLAIVEAMPSLNATLAAGRGTRLAVRIGMHTGPVVIADGGEVFGETANVAARVQGAAGPDTVVITAATQRLVAGLFVVEDLMMSPPALRKFTIGSPRSSKADGSLDTTEDGRLSIDRGSQAAAHRTAILCSLM